MKIKLNKTRSVGSQESNPKGELTSACAFIRKERCQFNDLRFQLEKLEKEEQIKSTVSRKKVRVEINEKARKKS